MSTHRRGNIAGLLAMAATGFAIAALLIRERNRHRRGIFHRVHKQASARRWADLNEEYPLYLRESVEYPPMPVNAS
jgi:hypothetical protein